MKHKLRGISKLKMKQLKILLMIILQDSKQHPKYIFCMIISSILTSGIAYYPAVIINRRLINIVTSEVESEIASIVIAVIF